VSVRRARLALAATLAVALVGCDLGGPGGPAQVAGTVTGDPLLGAAIVELSWDGVRGFEGRGDTRVYAGAVPESDERHRVVLVGPSGGDLTFTIDLEDGRLEGPIVTVVSAVGTNNLPLSTSALRVVLER
jgi:hypothetical protein